MPLSKSRNSLNAYQALVVGSEAYTYFSLKVAEQTLGDLSHLPCCMRILLENLLRHEDERFCTPDDMRALSAYHALHKNIPTISFSPARFLISDEAALSMLTDMAAFQEALSAKEPGPKEIENEFPLDITIGSTVETPEQRAERFRLIKWGSEAIMNVSVIPSGHGSSNHINLNALGSVVRRSPIQNNEATLVIPDTVLGTDQFFPTINGLGILGWKTDPLEIQAMLLGHDSRMILPGVLGVKLTGKIHRGITASDIAMTIAAAVSKHDPQGKIVEFHGPNLDHLSVPDRAIIARMVAETGALCSYFPIDEATLNHLKLTGHDEQHIALVETYAREQGLWRENGPHDTKNEPTFTSAIEIGLETVRPCLSAPNTINSTTSLAEVGNVFEKTFSSSAAVFDPLATVKHGDIALAVLSSRNGASHPHELVMAGIIARKAAKQGLRIKPWVKALFCDTSPVTAEFLEQTGLKNELQAIGFDFSVAEIDNHSPLQTIHEDVEKTAIKNRLTLCAISSVKQEPSDQIRTVPCANYLASPAFVVAFAMAGSVISDINTKPLGANRDGKMVSLKDLWPTAAEINAVFESVPLTPLYTHFRASLYAGSSQWEQVPTAQMSNFTWNEASALIKKPPYLDSFEAGVSRLKNIKNAKLLALFGDNVAASDIEPSGHVLENSPAGHYLTAHNIPTNQFLPYNAQTGNYEVMVRGAFSSPSLSNALLPVGAAMQGQTLHTPSQTTMFLFDAAERYRRDNTPVTLVAGKNFGHGEGQEWAAKIIRFLGCHVVVAESFDPAFRIDLIRLGILPLQIKHGISVADMKLNGHEMISFAGIEEMERPPCEVMITIEQSDGIERYILHCDIATIEDLEMLRDGSLWATALRTAN